MKRRHVPAAPDPRRTDTLTLPRGVLNIGDEFTVKGEGRYVFKYAWKGSEVTCWGPVASKEPKWRTFFAERVSTIHRPKKRETTP